jgi:Collagen triple helix repeat (20 copies)
MANDSRTQYLEGLRVTADHLQHTEDSLHEAVLDLRRTVGVGRVGWGLHVTLASKAVTIQPGVAFSPSGLRLNIDAATSLSVPADAGPWRVVLRVTESDRESLRVGGEPTLISLVTTPAIVPDGDIGPDALAIAAVTKKGAKFELSENPAVFAAAGRHSHSGEFVQDEFGNWHYDGPKLAGEMGAKGDPGPAGQPGEPGPAGGPGEKGDRGEKGDTGPIGPQGPEGSLGPQGQQGPPGTPGSSGAQGTQGPKGDSGDPGAPGSKGDTGDPGTPGPKGGKGDPGASGEKGDKGDAGAPGTKGVKGDAGAAGAKGDKGDGGAAGAKGDKGDAGAAGAKGDKGDGGAAGAKGDKGDVGAAGAKGDRGDAGAAGAKGDKGDAGAAGAKGDKGDVGAAGAKGDKGDAGAAGAKGDRGDAGAAGAKGDKGDAGAAGAKGDKGDAGAPGAKGDKGDPGAVGAQGLPGSGLDKDWPFIKGVNWKHGTIMAVADAQNALVAGLSVAFSQALAAAILEQQPPVVEVWFESELKALLQVTTAAISAPSPGPIFVLHGSSKFVNKTQITWTPSDHVQHLQRTLTLGGKILIRIHCGHLFTDDKRPFSSALDAVTGVPTLHVPGGVFESWFFVKAGAQ